MADVFISYARTERDEAEAIKARLETLGLSVFLDVEGLDGGDVFSEVLDREVKTSGVVLGLWSPTALTRPWVQIECDIGKRRGVLVPVAIKPFTDMQTPAAFWNIQFIDLADALDDPNHANWVKLTKSLARSLKRPDLLAREAAAVPHDAATQDKLRAELVQMRSELAALQGKAAAITDAAPRKASPRGDPPVAAIAAAIGVLVLLGGAGVWFADPFHWHGGTTANVAQVSAPPAADARKIPVSPPRVDQPASPGKGAIDPAPAAPAPSQTAGNAGLANGASNDAEKARVTPPATASASAAPAPAAGAPAASTGAGRLHVVSERKVSVSSEGLRGAMYSPDGSQVVLGSGDNILRILDVQTGKILIATAANAQNVRSVAFSPDGTHVAGAAATATIWEARTGKVIASMDKSPSALAYSRDGRRIATASFSQVAKVWDVATGEARQTLTGHTSFLNAIAFSPDGSRIATGSSDDTARTWDASTGQPLVTFKSTNTVECVDFSPDGSRLVTGSTDGSAQIWDSSTGRLLVTLQGHVHTINSVAFSPDGQYVLTASDDNEAPAGLWNAKTGKRLLAFPDRDRGFNNAVFSPDGRHIMTASDGGVAQIWRIEPK